MRIDFDFWHPSLPEFKDLATKLPKTRATVRFITGDWWCNPKTDLENTNADIIFWLSDEILNDCHTDLIRQPNNFFIVAGISEFLGLEYNNIYCPWLTWFDRVAWANNYKPLMSSDRAFLFDALLGLDKWHRSWVFDKLIETGLHNRSLISISHHADPKTSKSYESPELHLYELSSINRVKQTKWERNNGWPNTWNSQDTVEEHDYNHTLVKHFWKPTVSVLIPERIYDASWYSIICETHYQHCLFLTEKTAKALMSQRVFVMFSAAGQLEFLKNQGYQTFHGIIDESYDQIQNNTERFNMAWKQVEYLASCDPTLIYNQAQKILEHNRKRLIDVKTRQKTVERFILDRIDSI